MAEPAREAMPLLIREAGETFIVLGPGTTGQLPSYLDRLGRERAYLVTSPSVGSARAGARVREALKDRLVGTYSGARPHVPIDSVEEAFEDARRGSADVVVGLGGGSPIGTAKAVASRLLGDKPGSPTCVVAALPTTYAGSEVTPVFGTTDVSRGKKSVVRNPLVRPRLAVYDPELAIETPPRLTASTGMNALAHCIEGLYAKSATSEDRAMARHAAGLLIEHLPSAVAAPGDVYHRYKLFEASMEAGLVLASAGMGIHHGLCHVLGGRFNAPHGELNGVILPHAMRFNVQVGETAFLDLAPSLGIPDQGRKPGEVAADVCDAVAEFVRRLGLPERLRELGIDRGGLEMAAQDALESAAVRNNPRQVTDAREVLRILEAAW